MPEKPNPLQKHGQHLMFHDGLGRTNVRWLFVGAMCPDALQRVRAVTELTTDALVGAWDVEHGLGLAIKAV
jgi:hypothetical protein